MEVPSHLAGWANLDDVSADEFGGLQVPLRCPCGGDRFRMFYPGAVRREAERDLAFAEWVTVDDWPYLRIDVECFECGRTHTVFDSARSNGEAAEVPLVPWECIRCGDELHHAAAWFTRQPDEEIESGHSGIDVTCSECGLYTWLWVESEGA